MPAIGDDEHEIGHKRTVPERPFGEVEALHDAAPSRRTFWPGRSVCTPAVTTISPVSSPCEMTTSAGSYRETSTLRSDTVWLLGSTTHTAGRPLASVSALGGTCTPEGGGQLDAAGDGGTQCHRRGWIDDADLDLECSGGGIRLRRNLPHAAGCAHGGVVGQRDLHHRIARTRADELFGYVEHRVAPALTRDAARSSVRHGPLRPVRRRSR